MTDPLHDAAAARRRAARARSAFLHEIAGTLVAEGRARRAGAGAAEPDADAAGADAFAVARRLFRDGGAHGGGGLAGGRSGPGTAR